MHVHTGICYLLLQANDQIEALRTALNEEKDVYKSLHKKSISMKTYYKTKLVYIVNLQCILLRIYPYADRQAYGHAYIHVA